MKSFMKKSLLGLVVAGLMSSSLAMHPAEARSHSGRNVAIGVGVVAVVALLIHHHKHHKSAGGMTPTTMTPTSSTTAAGGTATATP